VQDQSYLFNLCLIQPLSYHIDTERAERGANESLGKIGTDMILTKEIGTDELDAGKRKHRIGNKTSPHAPGDGEKHIRPVFNNLGGR
jgi:hypothetical protein